jgi:hypothetical protein
VKNVDELDDQLSLYFGRAENNKLDKQLERYFGKANED